MDQAATAAFVNDVSGGAAAGTITRRRCLTFGAPSYRGGAPNDLNALAAFRRATDQSGGRPRGSSSDVPSRTCYRGGSVLLRPAVDTKACRFYSFPATLRGPQEASGRNARVCGRPAYWRAIAMRIASSGETRCSEFSAASAMASWTPLTRPLKALPREP
jgi:hypothetical protein